MNVQHDLNRRVTVALEDGPTRAPEAPIHLALAHARANPRRRDPLASLRKDPMNPQSPRYALAFQPLPLLAVAAVIFAAALGAATAGGFFDDRSGLVPPVATPSPTSPDESVSPVPSVPPSASAAPSASPSPVVMAVDLIENVGADATIDITDLSGRLVQAGSGVPGDGASVAYGSVVATALDGSPATVVLTWGGLPCDTTHELTIDAGGLGMMIKRPACEGDAIGVDHVLLLTFDRPVDPTKVDATIETVGN